MGKLKKIGIGSGIAFGAFWIIIFGIAIATYTPAELETNEIGELPIEEEIVEIESYEKPITEQPTQETSDFISGYKPHEEIKELEFKYTCEPINDGMSQGFRPTQEELSFWLNYCLADLFPEKNIVGEPVELIDLGTEYPGISYCNSLENTIKNNDRVYKDVLAEWFVWCINP